MYNSIVYEGRCGCPIPAQLLSSNMDNDCSRREQDVQEEHRGRALAGNATWRQKADPRPDRDEAATEEKRRRGLLVPWHIAMKR